MSYKIAAATSDGINIDLPFGRAKYIFVYTVNDDGSYYLSEKRRLPDEPIFAEHHSCGVHSKRSAGCGCNGTESPRIADISDCRCLLCSNSGANVKRQLERKAISVFDIEDTLEEALGRLVRYYSRGTRKIRSACKDHG